MFAFAYQGFEILSICWTELYVSFVHLAIFYQIPNFVKDLIYDVVILVNTQIVRVPETMPVE